MLRFSIFLGGEDGEKGCKIHKDGYEFADDVLVCKCPQCRYWEIQEPSRG